MFLEVNFDGIIFFMFLLLFGPALVFFLVGLALRKKHKKAAKVFFILGVVYMIISLGTCGILISGV